MVRPVIPVNRVVNKTRIIRKNGEPRRRRGTKNNELGPYSETCSNLRSG
jgi:hypothetical protein